MYRREGEREILDFHVLCFCWEVFALNIYIYIYPSDNHELSYSSEIINKKLIMNYRLIIKKRVKTTCELPKVALILYKGSKFNSSIFFYVFYTLINKSQKQKKLLSLNIKISSIYY